MLYDSSSSDDEGPTLRKRRARWAALTAPNRRDVRADGRRERKSRMTAAGNEGPRRAREGGDGKDCGTRPVPTLSPPCSCPPPAMHPSCTSTQHMPSSPCTSFHSLFVPLEIAWGRSPPAPACPPPALSQQVSSRGVQGRRLGSLTNPPPVPPTNPPSTSYNHSRVNLPPPFLPFQPTLPSHIPRHPQALQPLRIPTPPTLLTLRPSPPLPPSLPPSLR